MMILLHLVITTSYERALALLLITDDGIDYDTHWDTNRLSESSYILLMFCM